MSDDQSGVVTLKVRVTPEFREKIIASAKLNNRSMNAEIVHRLEQTYASQVHPSVIAETIAALKDEDNIETDPRARRRLKNIAIQQALEEISGKELIETIFSKLSAEGTRLTVEEIKRGEELSKLANADSDSGKSSDKNTPETSPPHGKDWR